MQRVGVLNGENITYDHDISGLVRGLNPSGGIIEGGIMSGMNIQPLQAIIPCIRSNGQKLLVYFESDEVVTVSGAEGDVVYIEITQSAIDDGQGNAENGTGIAKIKSGTNFPNKNAIKLAEISNGQLVDKKYFIPDAKALADNVQTINTRIETAEQNIQELQEAGVIDHLEEGGIIGEKYTLADVLFKQYTPKYEDSVIEIPVGNVNDNKEVHIQRIGSGIASNKLKLKIKIFGSPTTTLVAEVRKGVKVDVSANEAYWYGGEYICSGSLSYTPFTHERQEVEFTMNKPFGGIEGELLDIVVYQQGKIVNASNYYILACDSTQYSEAFSCVRVNGSTKNREKLMPYAVSDGFAQSLLCKINDERLEVGSMEEEIGSGSRNGTGAGIFATLTNTEFGVYNVYLSVQGSQSQTYFQIFVGGKDTGGFGVPKGTSTNKEITVDKGEKIELQCNTGVYTFSRKVFRKKFSLIKRAQNILYPKSINNIGQFSKVSSFGSLEENRKGEINVEENYEKTEGSIPLTSVAGFISIRGKNGKILKIPFIK